MKALLLVAGVLLFGKEEGEEAGDDDRFAELVRRAGAARGEQRGVSLSRALERCVSSGSLRHTRQSFRYLFLSCDVYGGFVAQFYLSISLINHETSFPG